MNWGLGREKAKPHSHKWYPTLKALRIQAYNPRKSPEWKAGKTSKCSFLAGQEAKSLQGSKGRPLKQQAAGNQSLGHHPQAEKLPRAGWDSAPSCSWQVRDSVLTEEQTATQSPNSARAALASIDTCWPVQPATSRAQPRLRVGEGASISAPDSDSGDTRKGET